jgi:hypothetical protein
LVGDAAERQVGGQAPDEAGEVHRPLGGGAAGERVEAGARRASASRGASSRRVRARSRRGGQRVELASTLAEARESAGGEAAVGLCYAPGGVAKGAREEARADAEVGELNRRRSVTAAERAGEAVAQDVHALLGPCEDRLAARERPGEVLEALAPEPHGLPERAGGAGAQRRGALQKLHTDRNGHLGRGSGRGRAQVGGEVAERGVRLVPHGRDDGDAGGGDGAATASSLKPPQVLDGAAAAATMRRSGAGSAAGRQRVEAAHRGDTSGAQLAPCTATGHTSTVRGKRSRRRWRMSRITAPEGEVTTPITSGR